MAKFVNLAADVVQWNILEARLQGAIEWEDTLLKPYVNVFHYHKFGGITTPNLGALADSMSGGLMAFFNGVFNVRMTDLLFSIRPLDDPTVPEQTQSVGAGAGTITGDPLSAALAAVITLGTGVRGRNFRGRKHIGGLSESFSTGGDELNSTGLTALGALATNLAVSIDDGGGNQYQLCVLSSTLSQVNGTPPVFTGADVTTVTLNHILGTMRRRKERIPA